MVQTLQNIDIVVTTNNTLDDTERESLTFTSANPELTDENLAEIGSLIAQLKPETALTSVSVREDYAVRAHRDYKVEGFFVPYWDKERTENEARMAAGDPGPYANSSYLEVQRMFQADQAARAQAEKEQAEKDQEANNQPTNEQEPADQPINEQEPADQEPTEPEAGNGDQG